VTQIKCHNFASTSIYYSSINISIPSIFKRRKYISTIPSVELNRNEMAHGDAREGKWRGKMRMEWVASSLASFIGAYLLKIIQSLPADPHSSTEVTPPPSDLNGLVRFAERPILVSARVPSRSDSAITMYAEVSIVWCCCARQLCDVVTLNPLIVTVIAALRRDTVTWTHCTRVRYVTSHTAIIIWISITVGASYLAQNVPDLNDVYFLLRAKFLCVEQFYFGVRYTSIMGIAVAQWLWRCAKNLKIAASIPDSVIGIFRWRNPSDRTMALGSTQPLTEMRTRSISWG
jgi:hypothetical protein